MTHVCSGQNSVLKTEAQAILGLCGLGITVTGFSGGNVIKSGHLQFARRLLYLQQ